MRVMPAAKQARSSGKKGNRNTRAKKKRPLAALQRRANPGSVVAPGALPVDVRMLVRGQRRSKSLWRFPPGYTMSPTMPRTDSPPLYYDLSWNWCKQDLANLKKDNRQRCPGPSLSNPGHYLLAICENCERNRVLQGGPKGQQNHHNGCGYGNVTPASAHGSWARRMRGERESDREAGPALGRPWSDMWDYSKETVDAVSAFTG